MKVTLGDKQYISLLTDEIDGMSFGYQHDIVLNSFQTGGYRDGFDTEQDAFEAGAVAIHKCIQDHLDNSTQKMSEKDMELVMKFFEEIKNN